MRKKEKQEIRWNLINSGLAGLLVLFGSFTTGMVTWQSLLAALAAAMIVAITKFRNYWISAKPKNNFVFSFI